MKFVEFKQKISPLLIFSLRDIQKLDAKFHRQRLNEWQDKGYIKKIVKGFYIFADLKINESVLFIIANKIFTPSYVSLEIALSYYNLIPESIYQVTSVSSRNTYSFQTGIAMFNYRKVKPGLMFGYKLERYKNHYFKIAEIEKAVLDYLYLNPYLKTNDEFEEIRINSDILLETLNQKKLNKFLKIINCKSLTQRTEKFMRYLNNA